jgi:hypothetical protein
MRVGYAKVSITDQAPAQAEAERLAGQADCAVLRGSPGGADSKA